MNAEQEDTTMSSVCLYSNIIDRGLKAEERKGGGTDGKREGQRKGKEMYHTCHYVKIVLKYLICFPALLEFDFTAHNISSVTANCTE